MPTESQRDSSQLALLALAVRLGSGLTQLNSTHSLILHIMHKRAPSAALMQHIRDITDPEHPYTLEQLNVVAEEQIDVHDSGGTVK